MKKLFLILFCAALVSCATTKTTSTSDGDFITNYDDISGITETIHKDLQVGAFYNLRDSLTGEREHLLLSITDGQLMLGVLYQNSNWAFLEKAVFIADGKRLEIALDNRKTNVVSGNVVREGYSVALNEETCDKLREILSAGSVSVAFIGSNKTTDKLAIKPKIRDALLATLRRF